MCLETTNKYISTIWEHDNVSHIRFDLVPNMNYNNIPFHLERRDRPVAGHWPVTPNFQSLIPDAENEENMIFMCSQIENYILSTSNNVDLHILWLTSFKL